MTLQNLKIVLGVMRRHGAGRVGEDGTQYRPDLREFELRRPIHSGVTHRYVPGVFQIRALAKLL